MENIKDGKLDRTKSGAERDSDIYEQKEIDSLSKELGISPMEAAKLQRTFYTNRSDLFNLDKDVASLAAKRGVSLEKADEIVRGMLRLNNMNFVIADNESCIKFCSGGEIDLKGLHNYLKNEPGQRVRIGLVNPFKSSENSGKLVYDYYEIKHLDSSLLSINGRRYDLRFGDKMSKSKLEKNYL